MTTKTIYFYGQKKPYGEFSNFYPCTFTICARDAFSDQEVVDSELRNKTISVCSSEQAIMWLKAVLMNDKTRAMLIETEDSPSNCKRLGRKVTPFDENKWNQWKEAIAVYTLSKKFASSTTLRDVLTSTRGKTIAEAAPNDRVWGIGISVQEAMDGRAWRGQNILGKALMKVRDIQLPLDQLLSLESWNESK